MGRKVFLITGTSTGLGAELVRVVLQKGDIAVATARDTSRLHFPGANDDNYLPLELDVTSKKSIDGAFDKAIAKFGQIDVVVNNAGYGLAGVFESYNEQEIRHQMEVNFFGLLDVTRRAVQVMREVGKGGVIQQVTSIGGLIGYPGFSLYSASKFAVEGFTEAIAQEVKPEWKIKFQCVEPGQFRTDWSGRSLTVTDNDPAYDHIDVKERVRALHGTQQGDPAKGALAMYQLATMQDPPLRAVIGADAYQNINAKLEEHKELVLKYKDISTATDFDDFKSRASA